MWSNVKRRMVVEKIINNDEYWTVELSEQNNPSEITSEVLVLGDIAPAKQLGELINQKGPGYPFRNLPEDFFNADIVLFDMECCLSKRGVPWEPKPVHMRGDPQSLDIFPFENQRYVASVANNHFLDYGAIAAADTIKNLATRGIACIGAQADGVIKPLVLGTPGGSVAFLSYAPAAHPLGGQEPVNIPQFSLSHAVDEIKEAKKQADVLVVVLHQGVEYSPHVDRASRKNARALAQAGADCVVCHHVHVVQAIEEFEGSVIFYGIGNFLHDVEEERRPHAAYTLALRMKLSSGKIRRINIEPFMLDNEFTPRAMGKEKRDELYGHVVSLSKLLKSRIGTMWSDWNALLVWTRAQAPSVLGMIQREGPRGTFNYYRKRIKEKIKNKHW